MMMMVMVLIKRMMMRTCSLLPARYICTLIHFFFRLQRVSGQSLKVKLALDAQIRATEPNKYGRETCDKYGPIS